MPSYDLSERKRLNSIWTLWTCVKDMLKHGGLKCSTHIHEECIVCLHMRYCLYIFTVVAKMIRTLGIFKVLVVFVELAIKIPLKQISTKSSLCSINHRIEPSWGDLGQFPYRKQARPISLSMSHNHVPSQKKPNYLCNQCQVWSWLNWWWCKSLRTQLGDSFECTRPILRIKWLVTSGFCHWGHTTNWHKFKASRNSLEAHVALWTWLSRRRS